MFILLIVAADLETAPMEIFRLQRNEALVKTANSVTMFQVLRRSAKTRLDRSMRDQKNLLCTAAAFRF